MQILKKVLIGSALIGGFAIYTQYEKNAEPAWSVNTKEFTVVNTIQEGMKREYVKFEELEMVDEFGFLKDANKTVALEEAYRTLKIEKIWYLEGRLYFLYSVDVKERDKDEYDVPRLSVKNMLFKSNEGKELVLRAGENMGDTGSRDEGFVYKHRLYRSMMLIPGPIENEEIDWSILGKANTIQLKDVAISNKTAGSKALKDISLKVTSDNPYVKVLKSEAINQTISFDDQKVKIKSIDALLYEQRILLDIPKNADDLIGFSATSDNFFSQTQTLGIIGTPSTGFYMPIYEMQDLDSKKKEQSITFHSSVHKDNRFFSWKVPKEDIQSFLTNKDQPIVKNEVIMNMNETKIIYEGLTLFEGIPRIIFSVKAASNKSSDERGFIPESYFNGDEVQEEYVRHYKNNLISIEGEKKEKIRNFDIHSSESDDKKMYYITFLNEEDLKNGEWNPIMIPQQELTINISNLTYEKPLPKPVTINYKNPIHKSK
ncbi:hypothetical protein AWM68_06520 [Fictibacillus phosphorivorans]|uniref:Uncharacterized protein n=1 Tax=Fictibacillus phosphorivorans TaxID=1221500 RepID=A0A163R0Y0_9BACL|nr:hypothetical protein [Fictibacillus phosphorivorans]KZE66029.1 hypothetical protein AWM68_06520 [Fictibacillus phosphorivorans]